MQSLARWCPGTLHRNVCLLGSSPASPGKLCACLRALSWFGCAVDRPMAAKPTDDNIDADLSRRALHLMNMTDMRLASTVGRRCLCLVAAAWCGWHDKG